MSKCGYVGLLMDYSSHRIVNRWFLFQQFPAFIILQHLHLLDGNLIEFDESFALWHTIVDRHSIDIG